MSNTTDEWWAADGESLQTYARNIETLTGRLGAAPLRGEDDHIPFRPGDKWLPKLAGPRVLSLGMWVIGADDEGVEPTDAHARFQRNWRNLRRLLWNPRRQFDLTKRVRYDDILADVVSRTNFWALDPAGVEPVNGAGERPAWFLYSAGASTGATATAGAPRGQRFYGTLGADGNDRIGVGRGMNAAFPGIFAPGQTVTFSFNMTSGVLPAGAQLVVYADGTVNGGYAVYVNTAVPTTGGRQQVSFSIPADADAGAGTIYIWAQGGGTSGPLDITIADVMVESGNTGVRSYFDGSTADSGANQYRWTGAANESISEEFQTVETTVVKTMTAKAQYLSGLEPVMTDRSGAKFTVDLKLADPYFREADPVVEDIGTGATFINPGDDSVIDAVLTFSGGGGTYTLTHSGTGLVLTVASGGGTVVVDTGAFTAVKDGSTNVVKDVSTNLQDGALEWMHILRDSNTFVVGGGSCSISYKPVYL